MYTVPLTPLPSNLARCSLESRSYISARPPLPPRISEKQALCARFKRIHSRENDCERYHYQPAVSAKKTKATSSKPHRKLVAFSILAITFLAAIYHLCSTTTFQSSPSVTARGGTSRRFAYAFLVAGCDPARPGEYRGYLYNVLVAKHILDASGSAADVVCMVRMAAGTNDTALPRNEEGWLRRSGVRVRYLAKTDGERSDSFYTAMFDKFRLLELIEYERVMFLDSDAIPVCNMDYVFDLLTAPRPDGSNASAGAARRNLILSFPGCPAQGGFFVLAPGAGEFDELNAIVRRQQESNYSQTHWPPFDPVMGWGSRMTSPWIDNKGKNTQDGTSMGGSRTRACYTTGPSMSRGTCRLSTVEGCSTGTPTTGRARRGRLGNHGRRTSSTRGAARTGTDTTGTISTRRSGTFTTLPVRVSRGSSR